MRSLSQYETVTTSKQRNNAEAAEMNTLLKVEPITKKFLIDVARASKAPWSKDMTRLIDKFTASGIHAEATDDDIERFDDILTEMEVRAYRATLTWQRFTI